MKPIYDSWDRSYKSVFGAIRQDETCRFTIRLSKDIALDYPPVLVLFRTGFKERFLRMTEITDEGDCYAYSTEYTAKYTDVHYYYFSYAANGTRHYIKKQNVHEGNVDFGDLFQLTVYKSTYQTPDFLKGGVMYQIFPDRFCKSGKVHEGVPADRVMREWGETPYYKPDENGHVWNNDYFGGDFAGIQSKLPYLHDLGVTCIYLNPIFESHENHRYNTADYMKADPLLGTNDDFEELCREAEKYGISVILDGVFSHTGADSVYFNKFGRYPEQGAYQSQDSPYYEWYSFMNYPDSYEAWWGIDTLPNVWENNEDYTDFICGDEGVLKYWLSKGAAGWRLDVADELPDRFLFNLRKSVKSFDNDRIVIGEVWEDASNKISYGRRRRYLQGGILDSVMNYVWRNAIIRFARRELTAEEFNEEIFRLYENYPEHAVHVMMNALSTHDTVRIINALAPVEAPKTSEERANFSFNEQDYRIAQDRLYVASFLQFTLPGMASIYYGDEIGMQGFEDPFNRAYMGEKKGDDAILKHYIALSRIKDECDALRLGKLMPAFCGNGVFGFYRRHHNETVFCVVNCGNTAQNVGVPKGELLFSKKAKHSCDGILLLPDGCAVFSPANGNATCSTVQ